MCETPPGLPRPDQPPPPPGLIPAPIQQTPGSITADKPKVFDDPLAGLARRINSN